MRVWASRPCREAGQEAHWGWGRAVSPFDAARKKKKNAALNLPRHFHLFLPRPSTPQADDVKAKNAKYPVIVYSKTYCPVRVCEGERGGCVCVCLTTKPRPLAPPGPIASLTLRTGRPAPPLLPHPLSLSPSLPLSPLYSTAPK